MTFRTYKRENVRNYFLVRKFWSKNFSADFSEKVCIKIFQSNFHDFGRLSIIIDNFIQTLALNKSLLHLFKDLTLQSLLRYDPVWFLKQAHFQNMQLMLPTCSQHLMDPSMCSSTSWSTRRTSWGPALECSHPTPVRLLRSQQLKQLRYQLRQSCFYCVINLFYILFALISFSVKIYGSSR